MAEDTNAAGPLAVLKAAADKFRGYEARHRVELGVALVDPNATEAAKEDLILHHRRSIEMAEACEQAAADLEALIEAAGKRERPAVTADDRKAVFMAGFSMGHQRGFYMETEGGLAIWPDHLPVPPGAEEAWAAVAAAIAKGGVHG